MKTTSCFLFLCALVFGCADLGTSENVGDPQPTPDSGTNAVCAANEIRNANGTCEKSPFKCKTDVDCRISEKCVDEVCVPKDPQGSGGSSSVCPCLTTGGSSGTGIAETGGAANDGTGGSGPGTGGNANGETGGNPSVETGGSSNVETGGQPNVETGGSSNAETGGKPNAETGGQPPATGGKSAATGGKSSATGGQPPATGGKSAATGGKPNVETGGSANVETGGQPPATGGKSAATGGKPATGGSPATGGRACGTGGKTAGTGGTPPCLGCGCEQTECDENTPCKGKLTCDVEAHKCVPIVDCDEDAADCNDACTVTYEECTAKPASGVRIQCQTSNPCLNTKKTCLDKCESKRLACDSDGKTVMDCKDGSKCGKAGQMACPPKGKVTFCHLPPGNPGHPVTITTSFCALDAHFSPTLDEKDIGHENDYFGRCVQTDCDKECSEACYATPGGKSPWRGWMPGKR